MAGMAEQLALLRRKVARIDRKYAEPVARPAPGGAIEEIVSGIAIDRGITARGLQNVRSFPEKPSNGGIVRCDKGSQQLRHVLCPAPFVSGESGDCLALLG